MTVEPNLMLGRLEESAAVKPINGWVDESARWGALRPWPLRCWEQSSPYQRVTIIDSQAYGKALLLDGCWMTAERQERHYHEAAGAPRPVLRRRIERVLVIGGGDGGTARECLRHPGCEHLDLVEIDPVVVELAQRHLPAIGGAAWR
jgi:spermidine synthase